MLMVLSEVFVTWHILDYVTNSISKDTLLLRRNEVSLV